MIQIDKIFWWITAISAPIILAARFLEGAWLAFAFALVGTVVAVVSLYHYYKGKLGHPLRVLSKDDDKLVYKDKHFEKTLKLEDIHYFIQQ